MKSLNRTLSLVLVLVMVLGLFGVAGAAFKDDAQIENTDAVNTMVALNIIEGKGNNTFDPVSTVKRGEMAKMICVALNGGKNPVLGTNTTPTYTDIKGHWAEAYIEYCTKLGIVAGKGDGTFDPEADVTGTEAAKMLLVALGYDAELEGYVGPAWAINVNVRANQNDLYTRLSSIDPNAGLSRDNAAQMVYNTLNAEVVALKADGTYGVKEVQTSVGDIVKTGTETWYKMTVTPTGAGLSPSLTPLANSEYKTYADADAAAKGTNGAATLGTHYTLAAVEHDVYGAVTVTQTTTETLGRKYLGLYTYTGIMTSVGYVENKGYTATVGAATFTELSDDPSAFVGQKVKVLHRYTDDVYGIYTHKDTTIADTTVLAAIAASIDGDNELKAVTTGKTYKTATAADTNLPVIAPDGTSLGTVAAIVGSGAPLYRASLGSIVKLIDNNGDGKLDLAVLDYVELYKVSFVSDKEVTLAAAEGTAVNTTNVGILQLDDIIAYDGMAKGDYVVYRPATGNAKAAISLTKATEMTAKVEGTKIEGGTTNMAKFGGVWMPIAPVAPAAGVFGDFVTGNTLTFIQVNGTIYAQFVKEAVFANSFLVVKGFESSYGKVRADVILSDGTSKEIQIAQASKTGAVNGFHPVKIDGSQYYADANTSGAPGYQSGEGDFLLEAKNLYGYTVDSDGYYSLIDVKTVAPGSIKAVFGTDGFATDALGTKTFGTKMIAPNAVVIVRDNAKDTYYVTTGANVMAWGVSATTTKAQFLYSESSGYNYAQIAYVEPTASYANTTSNYGYVVEAYTTTVDGKGGTMFTIWNGTENISAFAATADVNGAVNHSVVEYYIVKDGVIKIAAAYDIKANAVAVAAKNDAAGLVTFNIMGLNGGAGGDTSYDVTANTKVLFIDSKDNTVNAGKAQEGTIANIPLANKTAAGVLTGDMNAMYVVTNARDEGNYGVPDLALVVVEMNNKIEGSLGTTLANTANQAALNAAFANYDTVTISGASYAPAGISVPADKTLVVTGDFAPTGNVTVAATGALNVGGKFAPTAAITVDGALNITGVIELTAANTLTFAKVPSAAIMGKLEAITAPVNAKVAFTAGATASAGGKWYHTNKGSSPSTQGTNYTSGGAIPAGTSFTIVSDVYVDAAGTADNAWYKD